MTEDQCELRKQLSGGVCSPGTTSLGHLRWQETLCASWKTLFQTVLPLESNHFYLEFISEGCWTEGLISND